MHSTDIVIQELAMNLLPFYFELLAHLTNLVLNSTNTKSHAVSNLA